MRKLLARGIVEPFQSPFGIANVFVAKKPLQDVTPSGLRVALHGGEDGGRAGSILQNDHGAQKCVGFLPTPVKQCIRWAQGKVSTRKIGGPRGGSETAVLRAEDVRDMMERTRRANLRLKFEKCTFGQREVELLGHKVSQSRKGPNYLYRKCLK
jgi:hypothetical protein